MGHHYGRFSSITYFVGHLFKNEEKEPEHFSEIPSRFSPFHRKVKKHKNS